MSRIASNCASAFICAGALLSPWLGRPAHAQSPENVAVVINDNSPESRRIGEHYARTRALPDANVIHVRVSADETIARDLYVSSIETPIAVAIRRGGLHDRILYLVLTKGVPLRIAGTSGLGGTRASVDSELALLYRKMVGLPVAPTGKIDNPYFLGTRELRDALPFSHREHDIYLVTRIDAYTADEALALISRAQTPDRNGQILLDQPDNDPASPGNRWMTETARRLTEGGQGERITLETSARPAINDAPTLGFYASGVTDAAQRRRSTAIKFVPGAIAATLASANARTLNEPPHDWLPSASTDAATFFAGSAETLVGDLIRDGVTGVGGHVDEPYLLAAVRPDILFPAYLAGFNLAEAFYLATPVLSWTTVIIGDPLCRPFAGRESFTSESPIDPRTELPAFFSKRRLQTLASLTPDLPENVLALAARAESLLVRGDRAGSRAVLYEITALSPKSVFYLMNLAQLEEADGLYDAAIGHYRRIVELQPTNVVALNNLAYALAVHGKTPAEALPLAKRAASLAPRSASVIDTLGWVEHLLGNHAVAAKILGEAVKLDPAAPETHLHAAIVAEAMGDRTSADRALKEAVRLNPSLEQRDDARQLRERISRLPAKN